MPLSFSTASLIFFHMELALFAIWDHIRISEAAHRLDFDRSLIEKGIGMAEDQELQAMGVVLTALQPLGPDERKRVLTWAAQKLAIDAAVATTTAAKVEQKPVLTAKLDFSTDTIANIIGASSGPDLIIAAAAHLHFALGKATFSRHELASQMRAAPSHFKSTFINNLTSYLGGLTRADRLRLSGNDIYALSNKERQALEARLAAAE
ncbi:MAG: hypothetical protein KIT82_15640 [Bradyrhizobium sp.]|nr:hypothetical protein [Bradyrhizobium sp.]